MTAPSIYAPPYGQGRYGVPRVYGIPLWTPYTVEPIGSAQNFTAQSVNYDTILVQWSRPQVPDGVTITRYRLIQNRYGFPTDENDGNIVLDSATYFGGQYQDQDIIPGTFHYYGFYLETSGGLWFRAGFTSCLSVASYDSGTWLFNQLPVYFQGESQDPDLTYDRTGNLYLQQYLNVIGWGLDYLKTQYDMQFDTLNEPLSMSLRDLYALATELGIPFQPETPPATMRKAVANWTRVAQQRGTLIGIANQIGLLTDFGSDMQVGVNKLLENDQSLPQNPGYLLWNPNQAYYPNELATYQNLYLYKSIANSLAETPTGSTSANTWWSCLQDVPDPFNTLNNPSSIGVPVSSGGNNTGTANTLEAIYSGQAVTYVPPAAGTLTVGIGEPEVGNVSSWQGRTFRVTNQAATAQTVWLRTVARNNKGDINTANWVPDKEQVVLNGIPIPQITPRNEWNPETRYKTHDLVTYNNVPFQAQRASRGAAPPIVGQAVNHNPWFNNGTANWTFAGCSAGAISNTVTSVGISFVGSNVLELDVPNGSASPTMTGDSFPTIPGATYGVTFWVKSSVTFTNIARIIINWTGPNGLVSASAGTDVTVGSVVNGFTPVTFTTTAPPMGTNGAPQLIFDHTFTSATTFYIANPVMACYATPEWIPMSKDHRLRYMFSAYCSQSLLVGSNQTTPVTPFTEFYDSSGSFSQRVFARTATPGTPAPPITLSYDSFTTQASSPLTGRTLDSDDAVWSSVEGQFMIGGFNGGCTYPNSTSTPTIAVVNGPSNGIVAATFTTTAISPLEQAVIFRYIDASNYFHAGPTALWIRQSGTFTNLGTYSTAFHPGDRMYVKMNGSTITILRNGAQVLQVTNSTFSSATQHGIGVEQP